MGLRTSPVNTVAPSVKGEVPSALGKALELVNDRHLNSIAPLEGLLVGIEAAAQKAGYQTQRGAQSVTLTGVDGSVEEVVLDATMTIPAQATLIDELLSRLAGGCSREDLEHAVLEGLASKLGPHASYRRPEQASTLASKHVVRYGFEWPDTTGTDHVLGAPPKGSAAAKAGIPGGAKLVEVDGLPVQGVAYAKFSDRFSRPEINIVYEVDGRRFKVRLARSSFVEPFTRIESNRDGLLHLRINAFGEGMASEVREALDEAKASGQLRGLILDLRGNLGGLMPEAANLLELLLDDKVAWAIRTRGLPFAQQTRAGDAYEQLPVVVLVNGSSASSSELTTAALQGHGRAVVLGSGTYGKGVGQHHNKLPNGGTLAFTTMGFETPMGRYHGIGLMPTVCTAGIMSAVQMDERIRAALEGADHACPKVSEKSEREVQLATRILNTPALYARLARRSPVTTATNSERSTVATNHSTSR